MAKVIVTTSWDDGHIKDLQLAGLLSKYNLKGTFYIAPADHEFTPENRLTSEQIRNLDASYEIGAHTVTHPRLTTVSDEVARTEITQSKTTLETILAHSVPSFCYPAGMYTSSHVQMVKNAGFTYARTVERFRYDLGQDLLTAPSSIHAYRHWSDLLPIAKFAKFNPLLTLKYLLNWDELAIAMFDRLETTGGIFHIWGHSWEIDKNGDWTRLEHVLGHISGRSQVSYLTNGELV